MPRFMWFIIAALGLIVGYYIYGKIVEKVFEPNPERKTPAIELNDGVDYVTMPRWKLWLIQLLNIAGVGPVFGPSWAPSTAPPPYCGSSLAPSSPVPCTITSPA